MPKKAKAKASTEKAAPDEEKQAEEPAAAAPTEKAKTPVVEKAEAPKEEEEEEDRSAAKKEADSSSAEKVPLTEEEAQELAKYDLTSKLAPFLDEHFIFPILQFLQETGIYKAEDITRAELVLLERTNMVDFALDKYTKLDEEPPEGLVERREEVVEKLQTGQQNILPLLAILEDEDAVARIANAKRVDEICEAFDIRPEMISGLLSYAKLQYDCGSSPLSGLLLKHYATFAEKETDIPFQMQHCMWGRTASALLNGEYEDASKFIRELSTHLENCKMTKSEILLHKTWLLHWSLFPIFIADNVPIELVDVFLSEKSLSVMSLSCPHLLRYVCSCLILHKRLKHLMKETMWIIYNEQSSYSDPITRFLIALQHDLDFDEAQRQLQLCAQLFKSDYFLQRHWAEFEECARLLIFELYCRIHQCINIGMIASKLNMGEEEAELWIVKLIQSAKLDARLDSEKSRVVMCKAPPSVYQQVIEKTKNLSFRSTMLLSNLEKRESERKGP